MDEGVAVVGSSRGFRRSFLSVVIPVVVLLALLMGVRAASTATAAVKHQAITSETYDVVFTSGPARVSVVDLERADAPNLVCWEVFTSAGNAIRGCSVP